MEPLTAVSVDRRKPHRVLAASETPPVEPPGGRWEQVDFGVVVEERTP